MNIKKYIGTGIALALVGATTIASPAFADSLKMDLKTSARYDLNEGRREKEIDVPHIPILKREKVSTTTPVLQGNGQPIVGGMITTISSTTVTIKNSSNVTYTVDTTHAKIVQGKSVTTLAQLAIGDSIIVQGSINGNSVVATSIIDVTKPGKADANATTTAQVHRGFFKGIGHFFIRIFGF